MMADAGFAPRTLEAWNLDIDFEDWIARMRTPPDRVEALRALADRTDPEVQLDPTDPDVGPDVGDPSVPRIQPGPDQE